MKKGASTGSSVHEGASSSRVESSWRETRQTVTSVRSRYRHFSPQGQGRRGEDRLSAQGRHELLQGLLRGWRFFAKGPEGA